MAEDIYRSHSPYAFIYIGGELCEVKSYELEVTTRGEASNCRLVIPIDNIDSTLFANDSNDGKQIPIELYVGYMQDEIHQSISQGVIDEFAMMIHQGRSKEQRMFSLRFSGFVTQPEWSFGEERMLYLTCHDWSQFLREYKWEKNLKDGDTEVSKIIGNMQGKMSGIKIVADSYSGTNRLGEKDAESNSYVYRASGKSYWEILTDCALKLNKKLFVEGQTIYITRYRKEPVLWPLYYGPYEEKVGLKRGQYFSNLTLRYGQIGESAKTNVVVDIYSSKVSKKGKEKATYVRYPENAPIKSNTLHIKRRASLNMDESELKVLAENIFKKFSKKNMTGNVFIPFANNFMTPYDLVQFVADEEYTDLQFVKDYYFCVNSISESYGVESYTQSIDIDTDPDIDKKTVTLGKRVSPPKPKPKTGANK